MRSSRRGFSLAELAVYAAILLMLMGGVTMVVIAGSRYMHAGVSYQRAQSEAMVAMRKLTAELSESTPVGRAPVPPMMVNSGHIIFLSPTPPPPATAWSYDGTHLQYHFWLCYYWNSGTRELVRARLPVSGGPVSQTTVPPPTAPPLSDFQPPKNNDLRVVARDIARVELSDGPTANQIGLVLMSSVATASDKQTEVTMRSVVQMPNP